MHPAQPRKKPLEKCSKLALVLAIRLCNRLRKVSLRLLTEVHQMHPERKTPKNPPRGATAAPRKRERGAAHNRTGCK